MDKQNQQMIYADIFLIQNAKKKITQNTYFALS